jgi:hypothetical protein
MATLESSLLASEIVRILGVSSLPEAVTNTRAARDHWNLPDRFVVLDDHQDGGVRQQGLSGKTDGAGKSRPGMLQVLCLCYNAARGRANPVT